MAAGKAGQRASAIVIPAFTLLAVTAVLAVEICRC
jgi:hypothetical protein